MGYPRDYRKPYCKWGIPPCSIATFDSVSSRWVSSPAKVQQMPLSLWDLPLRWQCWWLQIKLILWVFPWIWVLQTSQTNPFTLILTYMNPPQRMKPNYERSIWYSGEKLVHNIVKYRIEEIQMFDFKIDQNPFKILIRYCPQLDFKAFHLYSIYKTSIKKPKIDDFKIPFQHLI